MRILLLNQFFHPDEAATSQFLTDLACELRDRGHQVSVICGKSVYEQGRGSDLPGMTVHRAGLGGRHGRGGAAGKLADYACFMAGAFCRLAAMPPGDVVVTLSTPPMLGLLGLFARARGHGRFVYWVQDVYPEIAARLGVLGRGVAFRVLDGMSRRICRGADRIVALGAWMARRLEAEGCPPEKIRVAPHWPLFEPGPEACRETLGWGDDFVLLYSGNMGRAHEIGTFLEAFDRFSASHRAARLVFAGEGYRRKEVDAFKSAHPSLRIEWIGHRPREDLGGFLACADAHLISQRPEADGLVVPSKFYGVLASGRPLCFVGSAENEIGEIISRYGIGERVDPGDAAALAAVWARWAGRPELLEQMGQAALDLARSAFSRTSGISRMADLVTEDRYF